MGVSISSPINSPGRTTGAYYGAFVALGLATAAVGPTLPGLAEQAGAPLAAVGAIFASQAGGYILGSLLGGQLYDRMAGHPVMGFALVGIAGLLAFVPLVGSVALLTLLFFGVGLFQGALDVGGNALIGWLHGSRVGPYMNGLHFFFGLGAFVAPLVVAMTLGTVHGVAWSYWTLAGLILASALLLVGLPSPPSRYTHGQQDRTVQPWLLIGLVVFFYFLYAGAEHTFGGWIFSYTASQEATGLALAAYLNSAFWGAFTLGRLVAIPIARRVRPRTILLTDLLIGMGSLGVILLWPNSMVALWAGVIGLGLGLASIFPTMLTWAGRRIRLTGSVTGLFFVGSSVGVMILPWLTGQFFDRHGPSAAIWTVMAVTVGALLVFLVIMARGGEPTVDEMMREKE